MDLYTAIVLITAALLIITIIGVCTNRVISNKMKEGSIAVCVFIAVAFFCEWISVKVDGADASFATLHGAAKLIEFCVAPTMGFVAAYSYSDIKRPQVISVVIVIHTLFEFIAFKNQWVFYVDANNIYHRASLYLVYIVVFSLSSIYCFVSVLNEERKYYAKFVRKIYGKFGNCYRYGGDEFCVILSKNLGEVEQLNNTFITEIRKQQNDDDKVPNVSIGYAYYDGKEDYIQNVIEEADEMMYSNKN